MTARPVSSQPIPHDAHLVFSGNLFHIYQWNQVLYDGSVTTFEKAWRPDSAYVFPVVDRQIVVARQDQPGTAPRCGPIGGRVERDESPADAARRELAEEAGLEAAHLRLWYSWQPLIKVDWAVYVFVARECQPIHHGSDPGERTALIYTSLEQLLRLAASPDFSPDVALPLLRSASDLHGLRRVFFPEAHGTD